MMRGMLCQRFAWSSTDDFAVSASFHKEFAAAPAICQLSITAANENDDEAGITLGFLSYTYTDPDGAPHEVPIDFGSQVSVVAHNQMTRVDWYMRIYRLEAAGYLNIFFWDSVV